MNALIPFPRRPSPRLIRNAQNNVLPFRRPTPAHNSYDETLDRLVKMTLETNLIALDKMMAAIKIAHEQPVYAATRLASIGNRMVRAAHEVGLTLPAEQRASYNGK